MVTVIVVAAWAGWRKSNRLPAHNKQAIRKGAIRIEVIERIDYFLTINSKIAAASFIIGFTNQQRLWDKWATFIFLS